MYVYVCVYMYMYVYVCVYMYVYVCVYMYVYVCVYVTGYWKTDHNVTLGQLHFIGPANSYTHALSMH